MDSTALRWVLAVIGVVVIAGVYLFSVYQNHQRRGAAVKTFTRDELDSEIIADEEFRHELSNINTMLDQQVDAPDLGDIRINPALDGDQRPARRGGPLVEVPRQIFEVGDEDRVVHVLKAADDRVYSGQEIAEALQHAALDMPRQGQVEVPVDEDSVFLVVALSADGSLGGLDDPDFFTHGLVCWFDRARVASAAACYELMLKKLDELVRATDMKVYDEQLHLLTLRQVTETRNRLAPEV
jgi:FtsZ-interacting cell division protein ZipA